MVTLICFGGQHDTQGLIPAGVSLEEADVTLALASLQGDPACIGSSESLRV